MKRLYIASAALLLFVAAVFSFYRYFKAVDNKDEQVDRSSNIRISSLFGDKATAVNEYTKLVFESLYDDGTSDAITVDAPVYMLGYSISEIENAYPDRLVRNFSDDLVFLTKLQNSDSQTKPQFIVSEKDGYVAIYYYEPVNGDNIMEITEIPVNALAESDQARLKEGIIAENEERLGKILEDYGS